MTIALSVAQQLVVCLRDIHHGNERYTERIAKHGEDNEGEVTEDDDDVTTCNGAWCHYGEDSLYVGLILINFSYQLEGSFKGPDRPFFLIFSTFAC